MKIDFLNKNVLITGGSRGIGRACAKLFAALNANVIITYKNNLTEAEQTIKSLNRTGNHSYFPLDITQP
ncbi:MAG TPA: SDR family oxidoreductase, partial [Flavisolibacter sp.]|nr:SDR family oxidoreductase [Flavisolibacter sp.]